MLPDGFRVTFDDRARAGHRAVGPVHSGKPAVLGRWTVRLFAALGIAGIIYGTLAPFHIDPGRSWSWNLQWHPLVPGDAIANVLVYVPVGIFLRLLIRRRGSWWYSECIGSLLLAAALSYVTEACQTVLVYRVPCWVDWCCNVTGALAGLALAPVFQRLLRAQHAWLYQELRARPFSAAAAATIILVTTAGLMPFDLQPTPSHLSAALTHARSAPLALPWTTMDSQTIPLEPVQIFDKMAAAACFGLMAFLMAIGQREVGRSPAGAVWYAFTRCAALVAAIEMLQLFTIAHAADPRDLLMGWLFAGLGAGLGWSVLSRCPTALPRPTTVLHGLVMVLAFGVAGRAVVVAACLQGGTSPVMNSWLPMAAAFHRPWQALLSDYLVSLLQYALLAGLLGLWSRAGARRPSAWLLLATAGLAGLAGQIVALLAGRPMDTAQLLIALFAAWLVLRLDRAIFGRRKLTPAALPADRGGS